MSRGFLHTTALCMTTALMMASCSPKLKPLSEQQFTAEPHPLELVGEHIPTTISVNIPTKWMHKKAKVSFLPVLRYAGGETWGMTETIQGEKVLDNHRSVSYVDGGIIRVNTRFDYSDPRLMQSDLYMTFNATINGKTVQLPEVKIGEGTLATQTLADASGATPIIAPDAFQRIIKERFDADIHFLIQQANIRSQEWKKEDVQEWKELVENAQQTPNQRVSVEVQAYASPDGGVELNEKLSAQRERNTTSALNKEWKKNVAINAHYTAQDWEGFRTFVEQSSIQDKELILRVLSMYSDPEEREQEIRNISVVYDQLAKEILPRLRRSRLTANIETIGKSDEELSRLAHTSPETLSIEELLYAVTLEGNPSNQERLYLKASQLYPKDARAYNNIGSLYLQKGEEKKALEWYERARSVQDLPEIRLNLALLSLDKGDLKRAEELIGTSVATSSKGSNEILALLYLKQGKYEQALATYGETKSNNAAIAQLLTKNYKKALEILESVERSNATTDYLKAIVSNRTGDKRGAMNYLREALRRNPNMVNRLRVDKEFANLSQDGEFQVLLR